MSWWDTGDGDDVIGDQSADMARHALQQIGAARAERSAEKPSLADLLQAIGAVALSAAPRVLQDSGSDLREIIAELKSGGTLSSGPLSNRPDIHDIASILNENLSEISKIYQERWERNPRISEWLSALAFVLRYRPEDFLRDGRDHPPSQLRIG